ncbi:MAG: isoprenyl transferase [Clostridiales bacterium]|jgi:undecaprenyl diphosphate synthase|uniref:isoprenyl transferase n=1 Tax=Aminipila sp. TaxID=2060095 RepID=UPI001D3A1D87|nr:isoprenyl transferase [Aminipila sp.]MBE6034533.1 isoprenyl transferase [Clostridiales bacterium]
MLNMERIPRHVAIVMDGNGRWAEKNKVPRLAGHNAGMKAMKEIVKRSSSIGVKYLTVYAFSTENWKRSVDEVNGIFKLIVIYVDKELKELHKNNVKVKILGDYSKLPKESVERINKALKTTENNTGLQFNIALNYGSRDEITKAVILIGEKVKAGKLEPQDITEETIGRHLYTGELYNNLPDPDLVIRTSGEKRLSNYLLWQSAYSELVYTDVLWPDFSPEVYEKCIEEYQSRDRRFGGR